MESKRPWWASIEDRRKAFRERALLYAEYRLFSMTLMNQESQMFVITSSFWKTEVNRIEQCIIREEDPCMADWRLDDYTVRGHFFDETMRSVISGTFRGI